MNDDSAVQSYSANILGGGPLPTHCTQCPIAGAQVLIKCSQYTVQLTLGFSMGIVSGKLCWLIPELCPIMYICTGAVNKSRLISFICVCQTPITSVIQLLADMKTLRFFKTFLVYHMYHSLHIPERRSASLHSSNEGSLSDSLQSLPASLHVPTLFCSKNHIEIVSSPIQNR